MKTIQIGRSDSNNLTIKHSKVSSKHCEIRLLDDGVLLLEDLDSTNCTFLNGKRIKQTVLNPSDKLLLADFELDLLLVLSLFDLPKMPTSLTYEALKMQELELKKQQQVYADFQKLKTIYDQYISDKKHLMRGNTLKSTGLRAGLSLIPIVGNALGILSAGVTGNVQEKMMERTEQFKIEYICPSCLNYLNDLPFENLEKRGVCLYCKAKWVRK